VPVLQGLVLAIQVQEVLVLQPLVLVLAELLDPQQVWLLAL
jgi:hypothetical protein